MKAYLQSINGYEAAIAALHESKRTYSEEMMQEVNDIVADCTDRYGKVIKTDNEKFNNWVRIVCSWGKTHITLLSFIDITCMVFGLHRAGQDDWDAHAKRYDNRIIRMSTRIKNNIVKCNEMSDYYKGKILTMDQVLNITGLKPPEEIVYMGKKYIKTINGYILEEEYNNPDVQRGLYMLSIPSNFVFKVNLKEFAHVYKERGIHGTANPEVKELAESIADQIQEYCSYFTRELLMEIKN